MTTILPKSFQSPRLFSYPSISIANFFSRFSKKIIELHNSSCLYKIRETQNTFQSGIEKYWIHKNIFQTFHDENLLKTALKSRCCRFQQKISISAFSPSHFPTNPFICFHLRTKITASKFLPRCHSWKQWRVKINTSKQRIFLRTASSDVSKTEMLWRNKKLGRDRRFCQRNTFPNFFCACESFSILIIFTLRRAWRSTFSELTEEI